MIDLIIFHQNMVIGGVEKVTLNLLKNLDRKKFRIKLVLVNNEGELLSDIPKDIEVIFLLDKKIKKSNIFSKYLNYIYEIIKIKIKIKKVLSENKGLFLIMNSRNLRLNLCLKSYKNKKIGWIHGNILNDKGTILEKINYKLFKEYNIIYNVSKEGKEDFDKKFKYLKEKSKYIYNSFDINEIKQKSNEPFDKIREKYIIAVGRLMEFEKGYDILIESIRLLKKEGINKKLYILGDGVDREKIQKKIIEFNLKENIQIMGFEDNPYKWMRNAELLILSSRGEGLPTVLIEALICKVPIISTDCKCGPKEILANGKYGVLVPVGDVDTLKDEIKKIISNKELQNQMREKSGERGADFSNEKIINKLEKEIILLQKNI